MSVIAAEPSQWLQLPGAFLLLVAFAFLMTQTLSARSPIYALLNAAGGAILAYEAFRTYQYGFLVLEGTWALIASWALLRIVVSRTASSRRSRDRSSDRDRSRSDPEEEAEGSPSRTGS